MILEELVDNLARFRHDPLGYARWAFPWGEVGTLRDRSLKPWQEDSLGYIGESLRDDPFRPIRLSRATGHGVGKSALGAILTKWAFDTCVDTRGVVTANTENQLRTKTWVELTKWHNLSVTRDVCDLRASALFSKDENHERTWRVDMVPWSENNTEAFAGLHNEGKRIFLMFDEASNIADIIWEVAEGALTDADTEILWVAFGNPTRDRGRFRDTFPDGRFAKRWNFQSIDSRTVPGTNLQQVQEWAEDYGENSDFFRVRVRGLPPEGGGESLIPRSVAVAATARPLPSSPNGAVVLGVDVARFGGDLSVIYPRQGLDARSRPPEVYAGQDTNAFSFLVREAAMRHGASAIFVDETGMGAGVVDNLRAMNLPSIVMGVNFSSGPGGFTSEECLNVRAEIWILLRDWLKAGGCIPEHLPRVDRTFPSELASIGYGFASKVKGRAEAIQLTSKKDIHRENGWSPDFGDALALTFAMPTLSLPTREGISPLAPRVAPDYHPLKELTHGSQTQNSNASAAAAYFERRGTRLIHPISDDPWDGSSTFRH